MAGLGALACFMRIFAFSLAEFPHANPVSSLRANFLLFLDNFSTYFLFVLMTLIAFKMQYFE